jgi:hypothetical protein
MTKTKEESFFPEGYKAPVEKSDFMRLEDGANTFRVLSGLTTGFEYWTTESKPVRSKTEWKDTPTDIKLDNDGNATKIKFFWSFLVYNNTTKQVQSLEVTQKSIQKAMQALIENEQWGNPSGYDITVTKSGKGLETSYEIMPNPHSEITPEVQALLDATEIDLEAIFN